MTSGFTLAGKHTLTNKLGVGPARVTADSMIATILRQAPRDGRASIAAWRQLSDILAQRGNQLASDDVRRAFHALALLRPQVPEKIRRDVPRRSRITAVLRRWWPFMPMMCRRFRRRC